MSMNRRGFTLVEILVAIFLTTVVGTSIYQLLWSTQRNTAALAQRMDVQDNVRSTVYYLSTVFRDLDASDGDIIAVGSNSMRFRSGRWAGVICSAPATSGPDVMVSLRTSMMLGVRRPNPTMDSVHVYRDGDPATKADDRWLAGGVTTVTNGVCADGEAAVNVTLSVAASSGGNDSLLVGVTAGAPVRGFQVEELSLYQEADGRWWLGQRAAVRLGSWSARQPVLGPYQTSGISLTFYDINEVTTATVTDVASVELIVRGESRLRARGRNGVEYMRDSLITRVALRNNRRF
jgi:prepilin-type N-terminal cleavage/methylation domain-containing protein